jgi:hypothetical protein
MDRMKKWMRLKGRPQKPLLPLHRPSSGEEDAIPLRRISSSPALNCQTSEEDRGEACRGRRKESRHYIEIRLTQKRILKDISFEIKAGNSTTSSAVLLQ